MSKTVVTAKIAQSVKALAEELNRLYMLIAENSTSDDAITSVPMEQSTQRTAPQEQSAPSVTLAEVRSCLAELSRAGYSDKVKELIRSHGAEKLSGIPESEYEALLAEAEVLKNGK